LLLYRALSGTTKDRLMPISDFSWSQKKVAQMARGEFLKKPDSTLIASGYCIQSLEAALWCFFNTSSYKDAVLSAVNLGDDADTTGAIVGQIAGAHYGVESIPENWLRLLAMRPAIERLAHKLYMKFGS
jgi:ADP-ribosyl-[dinitrogen reductase] hydrolase